MTTINANKPLWTTTIYFALSFFVLGASAMIHFFIYSTFDKVHEHISVFMELFNVRIIFLLYIPLVLLLFTSISLFWFAPKTFSKWAISTSVVLSSISMITTLFLLIPIQHSFSPTGFSTTKYNELLSYSLTFQLIPLTLQAVLALLLLNSFLSKIKAKWIFIALFLLAFYTAGTDFVEKLLNYPLWLKIGENEWLAFRQAAKSIALIWVYLIPSFLPLLLLIFMFWFRPVMIKKQIVLIYLALYLLILISTSIYFVPKLQIPLDKTYSTTLIEQLITMDFPLRFLPGLITYALTTFMFLKIAKDKIQKTE